MFKWYEEKYGKKVETRSHDAEAAKDAERERKLEKNRQLLEQIEQEKKRTPPNSAASQKPDSQPAQQHPDDQAFLEDMQRIENYVANLSPAEEDRMLAEFDRRFAKDFPPFQPGTPPEEVRRIKLVTVANYHDTQNFLAGLMDEDTPKPDPKPDPKLQAKFDTINKFFDNKLNTLECHFKWKTSRKDLNPTAIFSRSLQDMPPVQREACRIAHLLDANDILEDHFFNAFKLALAYNMGDCNLRVLDGGPEGDRLNLKSWHEVLAELLQNRNVPTAGQMADQMLEVANDIMQAHPDSEAAVLIKDRLYGGNSWLKPEDIPESIFGDQDSGSLILGPLEGTATDLCYSGEGSLITIAPSGTGKTQCHVLPNLLNYPGPVVVLDVKGECYDKTAKWRFENVGPVYRFAPFDSDNSACFNPLSFVRNDPEYVWEDAAFLVDMLLVTQNEKDPTWEESAKNLLTCIIAWAVTYKEAPGLEAVLDVLGGLHWDEFINESLTGEKSPRQLRRRANTFLEMAETAPKQRQGILQEANRHLSVWEVGSVVKVTGRTDWQPGDLRNSPFPSIYICVESGKAQAYASLLRVIIGLHIRLLTKTLPSRDSMPILFMLDEMPQLGYMPPIVEALEVGRQYGLKLWLFAQSLGQISTVYPNGSGMISNCAVNIFMNPSLADGTAERVSNMLGHREGVLDGSRQQIAELTALAGPEFKDLQIVFGKGTRPAKVVKRFAHSTPKFVNRLSGEA